MMRGGRRCAARLAAAIVLAGALVAGAGPARGAAPAAGGDEQPSPAAVEMRGIWVDNGTLARLGGPEGIGRLMRQVRQAGFNSVLVETIYRGNTLFPGPYQDPRFARWEQDPLEAVIREARAQGLFVHAWVWALAAGIYGRPGPLLADHPEWADRNLAGSAYSGLPTAVGWLDPSRPEVREWIAEQAAMLAHRYGVDGIHLDYARYNDDLHDPFGYTPHAQQAFRAETGLDLAGRAPRALPPPVRRAWAAWREDQVTAVVAAVRDALDRAGSRALLSAAVMPDLGQARLVHLQDWRRWLADGLVDLVMPMAYTSSGANLEDILDGLDGSLDAIRAWRDPGPLRRAIVPGLALFAARPDTIAASVDAVRRRGFGGVVAFSTAYLSLPLQQALAEQAFKEAAAPPSPQASLRKRWAAMDPLPPQPVPETPPVSYAATGAPGTTNLARDATVSVDSSFRGYGPEALHDGQRNDVLEVGRWGEVAWASAERPADHWIVLRWPTPRAIHQVDVYWALDRGRFFSSTRLRIEVYDDASEKWRLVWEYQGLPTHEVSRTSVSFAPVTTSGLRLWQPEGGGPLGRPGLMWVAEVEVYGPPATEEAARGTP
ncbi:family 10 glycosylhydrolase [Carboxydochorda subterranea]|uniref:Family 10 glycosylhydrolase n=1 Tax=Carboxydichorda subterranea TaxID=3109565 RepID=A0ABZ1C1Z1_9FIRM|nr:family 10 glycosylhydrolase [Limnochorda sp. L945t]WRP18977.1 family 10 glycosylhydrolase [Limnochorda sp. L945t]